MSDPSDFDFSEDELFRGLRLALPDDEAARQARKIRESIAPDGAWATSDELLMLLELGSESGSARVQRIRREFQESRYESWVAEERASGGSAQDETRDRTRWMELLAAEDAEWARRRSEFRRSLEERGRLPPEDAGS